MKVIVKGLPGSGKTRVMDIIIHHLKAEGYSVSLVDHSHLEGEEAYSVEVVRKKGARNVELGASR